MTWSFAVLSVPATEQHRRAWANSTGRCTVPVMMIGAIDRDRPMELADALQRMIRNGANFLLIAVPDEANEI